MLGVILDYFFLYIFQLPIQYLESIEEKFPWYLHLNELMGGSPVTSCKAISNSQSNLDLTILGSEEEEESIHSSIHYLYFVAHAPPAMVFFFLFLFLPLLFAFVLTAIAALCKPGCAVSAADTSSV